MTAKMTYLDWAATTPLYEESSRAMQPYLATGAAHFPCGGNANSLHSIGRTAFKALEDARASVARDLHAARPSEIIFTSGATEANNAALKGIVSACMKRAQQEGKRDFVPHIIVSAIEHDSVLAPARRLKAEGCELTILKVDNNGFISEEVFCAALQENTVLASIQMANNEIGTVQSIARLAAHSHAVGAFFHTDAVQSLGKLEVNLAQLGIDAASFSAHKFGGPKGVGVLYLKTRTPFDAFLVGGGQEEARRSGTQNVCGIAGLAAACAYATASQAEEQQRLMSLRDYLYEKLTTRTTVFPSVAIEANSTQFLPNVVNVCVEGFESETLILHLDRAGFAVSGGSACSAHSLKPSHVLQAIRIPDARALCSLRISFGRYTTQGDIDAFLAVFFEFLGGEKE
ncbi:MAG: cysteine desulfurase [Coriobacteriaceae bacterium]|nr:cysteine desulfurase [Coriobacteriaceae bacterium]